MNKNLWDVGRCAYCGIGLEYMERGHTAKCKKMHEDYLKSKNPVLQLNRIANALEKKEQTK